jgi:hypothetical protein
MFLSVDDLLQLRQSKYIMFTKARQVWASMGLLDSRTETIMGGPGSRTSPIQTRLCAKLIHGLKTQLRDGNLVRSVPLAAGRTSSWSTARIGEAFSPRQHKITAAPLAKSSFAPLCMARSTDASMCRDPCTLAAHGQI